MIIEYHRPRNIEEVLTLLARSQPETIPLGGGTYLSHFTDRPIAVVDLQSVGLNTIDREGDTYLRIGACVTLQKLCEHSDISETLRCALFRETTLNIRNVATIAGTICAANGRSPTALVLFAMDTALQFADGLKIFIGDWLPLRKTSKQLITSLTIPLDALCYAEWISKTPQDLPIVGVALTKWPSGRMRITVGGSASQPLLLQDGKGSVNVDALSELAGKQYDAWNGQEYYPAVVKVLLQRLLNQAGD
ncbi:MAG: hypothetical protein HPY45_03990 [Anaerolineae bacterium]|nr:hypothetical protein [Anaerolineae bacterium]